MKVFKWVNTDKNRDFLKIFPDFEQISIIFVMNFEIIMAEKKKDVQLTRKSLRTHKHIFSLNDRENKALDHFLRKYKIENKSRFIRETLMRTIIKQMEQDSPTLFD